MPGVSNNKYKNSARREVEIKKKLEEEGWFAVRSSGSHGIADVLALRPARGCTNPAHYQARFIQVKTSQKIKEAKTEVEAQDSSCGFINVEMHYYPVKNKAFFEKQRKQKEKAKKTS